MQGSGQTVLGDYFVKGLFVLGWGLEAGGWGLGGLGSCGWVELGLGAGGLGLGAWGFGLGGGIIYRGEGTIHCGYHIDTGSCSKPTIVAGKMLLKKYKI